MRYFKIEGMYQMPDEIDTDQMSNIVADNAEFYDGTFGGGIKEVDEEGNDLKE